MSSLELLVDDIINHTLYNFLEPDDIYNCLLASKLFHVFSPYQLEIIRNANKGFRYCLENSLLNEFKWLFPKLVEKMDPMEKWEYYINAFIASCYTNSLEITKWIYEESKPEGYLDCIDRSIILSYVKSNDNADFFEWAYEKFGFFELESGGPLEMFYSCLTICGGGSFDELQLNIAKRICQQNMFKEMNQKKNETIFSNLCGCLTLENIKWFYELCNNYGYPIDIHANDDLAFKCGITNKLEIAKWIFSMGKFDKLPIGSLLYDVNGGSFLPKKYFDTLKWLYHIHKKHVIPLDADGQLSSIIFQHACSTNLEVAKIVYDISLTNYFFHNSISRNFDHIFIDCCRNGSIEIAKWMYQLSKDNDRINLNINNNHDLAFRYSIKHMHYCTAKWLYNLSKELGTPIDIPTMMYNPMHYANLKGNDLKVLNRFMIMVDKS